MGPVRGGLIFVSLIAMLSCFIGLRRLSRVPNPDVRWGLSALLILSGTWAGTEIVRLLAPLGQAQALAYTVGLVVGLATVGAWLYFCSAYTRHEYHQNRVIRQLAVTLYLVVVSVKLTSPLHQLYFTTSFTTTPFRHVVIHLQPAHWVVTGVSYALAAVGFYLLFDMFYRSRLATTKLSGLTILAGVPAVLDILSNTSAFVFTFNYEPISVAIFAVGALYVLDEEFTALPVFWRDQVIDQVDDPIIVFDSENQVRDYNQTAATRFPGLADAVGKQLGSCVPSLAEALDTDDDDDVVALETFGSTRYYLVEQTPLTTSQSAFGQVVLLTDVTVIEKQRREVQRQNEQFDDFAEAISHELRNTLAMVEGYVTMLTDDMAEESAERTDIHRKTETAFSRMEQVIHDLTKLARYGQTLEGIEDCDLESVIDEAFYYTEVDELDVDVPRSGIISADKSRLRELFRNWFLFAAANGATSGTITLEQDAIILTDNGHPLGEEEVQQALAYGEAVPAAESGMFLPNLRTLARVHGWAVEPDLEYQHGVRLRITNIESTHTAESDF